MPRPTILLVGAVAFCASCGRETSRSGTPVPTPGFVVEDRGVLAVRAEAPAAPSSAQTRAVPVLQFAGDGEFMAFSPDGDTLLEAGGPRRYEIRLWDVNRGVYQAALDLKGLSPTQVGWYGNMPVVVGRDGIVRFHDPARGLGKKQTGARCRADISTGGPGMSLAVAGSGCVALYEDGTWLRLSVPNMGRPLSLAFDRRVVAVAGTDDEGVLRVWAWERNPGSQGDPDTTSARAGRPASSARRGVPGGDAGATAVTPHGAAPSPAAGRHAPSTRVPPGAQQAVTPTPAPPTPSPTPLFPDRPPLEAVVPIPVAGASAVPPWVVLGCRPGHVYLATAAGRLFAWKVGPRTLESAKTVALPPGTEDVRFVPGEGRFLVVTARGEIQSGDLDTGRIRWKGVLPAGPAEQRPRFLAVSNNGARAVVRHGRTLIVNLAEWRIEPPLPEKHPAPVLGLLWNHGLGRLIEVVAVPHGEATGMAVVFWPAQRGTSPSMIYLEPVETDGRPAEVPMALSVDGRFVAVAAPRHVYVLDAENGARYSRIPVKEAVSVMFHSDGESLYVVTRAGEVVRFEAAGDESGELVTRYGEQATAVAGNAELGVLAVALARHGRRSPQLELLAAERRQVLRRVRLPSDIVALRAAPAGKTIAGAFARGGIGAWRMPRGVPLGRLTRPSTRAFTLDVTGQYLLFGKADLRWWRVGSRRQRPGGRHLAWSSSDIVSVAAAPGRQCTFMADASGRVTVVDRKGRVGATLVIVDATQWLACTPAGWFAGTPAAFGYLRLRSSSGALATASHESGLHSARKVWDAVGKACHGR